MYVLDLQQLVFEANYKTADVSMYILVSSQNNRLWLLLF